MQRVTASLVETAGAFVVGICAWQISPYLCGMIVGAALVAVAQVLPVDSPTEEADL